MGSGFWFLASGSKLGKLYISISSIVNSAVSEMRMQIYFTDHSEKKWCRDAAQIRHATRCKVVHAACILHLPPTPHHLCLFSKRPHQLQYNNHFQATMRVRSPQVAAAEPQSDFDLSLMHRYKIIKRTLVQWSVHRSQTTQNWIATISRSDQQNPEKIRHIQFPFATEKEARTFCKSYAPPKMSSSTVCEICDTHPNPTVRHCRNCGASVCDKCSVRWGARMVPKTYSSSAALTQRVCKSCDWLSNAFCMTLLKGRFAEAQTLFQTVRVYNRPREFRIFSFCEIAF